MEDAIRMPEIHDDDVGNDGVGCRTAARESRTDEAFILRFLPL